ncbi:ATP-binding protein [Calycomorphotria hydatis]|nr:ATP-binding protein [Calycomorphotria hydatis]
MSVELSQGQQLTESRAISKLSRRFFGTLIFVSVLLLINQVIIQRPLLRLTTDAPVINVSGRQRMLSQRLSKAALAMQLADENEIRDAARRELAVVLDLWATAHNGLRHGDEALNLPGDNSAEVEQLFEQLDPHFQMMQKSARVLLSSLPLEWSPGGDAPQAVESILLEESQFLPIMERIVGQYELEARKRVRDLSSTSWLVTGLIIAALCGIWLFVLTPAARLIRMQFNQLRHARDELEQRVYERTEELAATNKQLAEEVKERIQLESERNAAQEQVNRIGRVNAMGEMASGLAHELNQPLGAIANYIEGSLVKMSTESFDLSEIRHALSNALGATIRAGKMIRGIRRFVSRGENSQQISDVGSLIEESVEFLRDSADRSGIEIRTHLAPNLPPITCDGLQIQQVVMNLVQNSIDALKMLQRKVGTVDVKVTYVAGRDVRVSVTDSGEGVPEELRPRIFEPYYSTRADGMGMGLTICRSIIESHQGKIGVSSIADGSSEFYFTIPVGASIGTTADSAHR